MLSCPWLILVVALLWAVMLFVPILTAVLYRLIFALLTVLIVAVIGHAPVLAFALAIGCVIASQTSLRSDMPFLAVLIALVPVGMYLYFFGFSDSQMAQILPLQRWVLTGPSLLAMVLAVLAAAVVLALAKLTRFKAGVIWPVLALMTAVSMTLFYQRIGLDELRYAQIAENLATGDMVFQPTTLESYASHHDLKGLNPQTMRDHIQEDLTQRSQRLTRQCLDFLWQHRQSDRNAAVLWIQAQCSSVQLDVPSFQAGRIRYSAAFASPASEELWQKLAMEYSTSPHAALAQWRLGQLALRRGAAAEADEWLHLAVEKLQTYLATLPPSPIAEIEAGVFQPPPSLPTAAYYAEALFRTRRLVWLMQQNKVLEDPQVTEAFRALLNENPCEPDYQERLGRIVGLYENTLLGDNLKLAIAIETTDPYIQAEMLIWLAKDERTDAAVEANYQLGMLAMQTARARALPLIAGLKRPEEYFQTVIAAPPNPWQELARQHLGQLR